MGRAPQSRHGKPEGSESIMRSSVLTVFVLSLILSACGPGPEPADSLEEAAAPSTLHVRATGMGKSLGIT